MAIRGRNPEKMGNKWRFEVYQTSGVQLGGGIAGSSWNWRLVSANNEVVCQSTQGFTRVRDAQRSISRLRRKLFVSMLVGCGPPIVVL